jgi:hypothetical protein
MLLPKGPSTSLPRWIVHTAGFVNSVWGEMPKAIGLVGSARSAVFCLLLPLSNDLLIFFKRCGGWMELAEPFVAGGSPIGSANTSKCFHLLKFQKTHPHTLVLLVSCVLIIAGEGLIGLHEMHGGDHLNCVSQWPAFPLFSPASSKRGTEQHNNFFSDEVSSL